MEQKLISVIIPTYMEEKYIDRTLISIKEQSYDNFEIIIADSESPDNTVEIANKYADKIISIEKKGISHGRNSGAGIAEGDILLFVDADTILEKDFLKVLSGMFSDKSVVCAHGNVTSKEVSYRLIYNLCSKLMHFSSIIGFPMFTGMCVAYLKEIFQKVNGFREDLVTAEDYDLSLRVKKFGKCVFVKEARAVTDPRRLRLWGMPKTIGFHSLNVCRYILTDTAFSDYPPLR
ncbi:MAG: hypothetical protein B6U86_03145 [Candidatus Altiarchaeales archaeon ex4484_43]|nr:MAG: hypothetical protein B6U86_03145 [Candidatus Altiarchaeales archaeon ex4484_43]